ncbi:MAG: SDR family NAD(P)-dependent oxidoreductase [Acidobacteria bacterium]|jgi:uncharacterized protein|nr:SDR family NAD(P)-dependent oxidoreductase [Acidobacteriota bacterium]
MKIVPGTPALVTGASSGIGREVALSLGRRHCRVALVARRREALEEVAEGVADAGGEPLVAPADVADEGALAESVGRTVEAFGGLRLVVANAGLGRYALVEAQAPQMAEQLIRVNYLGTVATVRHALPHLLAATPSHAVAVASSAGLISHRMSSAYSASKAAVIQYLAGLRLEVLDRGVGVTWVCPGPVDTPYFDQSNLDPDRDLPLLARRLVRRLQPDEVARALVRAVERNRPEVTLPAMMRFFVWTRRMTPRLADWMIRRFP